MIQTSEVIINERSLETSSVHCSDPDNLLRVTHNLYMYISCEY